MEWPRGPKIGRRAVVGAASAIVCTTAALAVVGRAHGTTAADGAAPAPPSRGVRLVGERYLAMRSEEASVARLRALVPGGRDELRRRIREDFAAGDTVDIRGWVMSRTECRACALAVLADAGRVPRR